MVLKRLSQLVALTAGIWLAWPVAADPLGLYLGGGVGRSDVAIDRFPASASDPVSFVRHATGWKALAGLRPLPWLGAEIEYVDLGHPSEVLSGAGTAADHGIPSSARVQGAAAFVVAYLPLPLPLLDIYGKLGASRLRMNGDTSATGIVGVDTCYFDPDALGCRAFHDHRETSHAAWGAGAQLRLLNLALRAEYERFGSGDERPAMTSVSLTWSF
jgi:OmpA-like transmembrane domain